MALVIPPDHEQAIIDLIRLSAPEFERLKELLGQVSPTAAPGKVAQRVEESFKGAEVPSPADLVSAIYSMIRSVSLNNMGPNDFVAALLDTVERKSPLSPEERKEAEGRIEFLIHGGSALSRSVKAHDVLTEHKCVYRGARVLTDIRPVFPEQLDEGFQEVVTIHTLKITYGEDGGNKEFFVALDSFDLRELKGVIERADRKSQIVDERLGSLSLRAVEPEH